MEVAIDVEKGNAKVADVGKSTKEGSLSSPKATDASSSTKLPPPTHSGISVYNGLRKDGRMMFWPDMLSFAFGCVDC